MTLVRKNLALNVDDLLRGSGRQKKKRKVDGGSKNKYEKTYLILTQVKSKWRNKIHEADFSIVETGF